MIWRNLASNFLTLLVVLLVAAAGVVAWGKQQYAGPGPSAMAQCVQVRPGASLDAVSKQLREQGAISSAYIFRTGADYAGRSRDLKFGSYLVPPNASMAEIVDAITAGGPSTCGTEIIYRVGVRGNSVLLREVDPATGEYVESARYNPAAEPAPEAITQAEAGRDTRMRLTVAEGVTSWQVVEGLRQIDVLAGEPGPVPPEGSLAPDTYSVEPGTERARLLADMSARQAQILQAAWEARPFDLPYGSPEEALIMASIVEKETGVADERPQVASVFVNRLRDGMRLQTDPTVIYGVTMGREVLDRGLRRSELDARTPYNTYQVDGLPPTPIANPGRAAIEAALNPADTEYLYFVADGTGGHAFATTLEEHNRNVARWREIEAEQAARAAAAQAASDG
ncbi:endolytic transglycosylase MltG [Paracoccus sp. S-4012]|uniref:endolytic transglycosylase MltG n=1 Tax=Paracoccus sp. S-4012 TaxID=2665648 RepID=UPI0012B1601D|nr:endolytic transglycosylase MltG [Paracoccus sp. S-4012]MRX50558.1 endolytic transglycosylase MltG [Paracoccus sp. S-4012]